MARFEYVAVDAAGASVKGALDATDARAASRRLAAKNLRVSSLVQSGGKAKVVADSPEDHPLLHRRRAFGVHPAAFAFARSFRELHEGGLPVGDAVKLLATRVTEPSLRALCKGVWRDLSEGMSLSASMSKRPEVFDEATLYLIAAGEATGNLVPVLGRVIESYESREAMRAKVIGAIWYPVFICLFATGVLGLFVFFIMPRMETMMKSLGGEFPLPVKLLTGAATLAVKGSPVIILLLVVVFFSLKKARARADARRRQDAALLKVPMLGQAFLHAEATRMAELLSTLLSSGVNAAQALKLVEKPVANTELRARFVAARRRVHDGTAISAALKDTGVFESEDLDLASVGENSGGLPRSFGSIAIRRRKALDATLTLIVRTLSVTFFGFSVGLIGFCLISIVMTIMSVTKNVGGR